MQRKEIVKALEKHFNVKARYLGTPSFAYEIKAEEKTYIISKTGEITEEQGTEVELDSILTNTDVDNERVEITLPFGEHTGKTLKNLINLIYSKQRLIKKSLELDEDIIKERFVETINKADIKTIDDFRKTITNVDKDDYIGLAFDFDNKTITFKFYKGRVDTKRFNIIIQLIALINKQSKERKYIKSKPTKTDNEKYTFRAWLMSLGMIGPEYKTERKQLLEKLNGHVAFRNPYGLKTHN